MSLARVRRALDRLLQFVVFALMIALTAVVVVNVVFRRLGNSLSWYDEVAAILLAWVTYYGAALAALRRSHIGFEGLINVMPQPLRRIAVFFAEAVVIAFFALLAWVGLEVLSVLRDDTLVTLEWVPLTLTRSVIPIGALLFIVAQLLSLPEYLAQADAGTIGVHEAGESAPAEAPKP